MQRLIVSCLASVFLLSGCADHGPKTSFDYSQVEVPQVTTSDLKLTNQKLKKINEIANNYITNTMVLDDLDRMRIYPYLANAQRDFAIFNQYKGSLGPVTLGILQIFDPRADLPELYSEDQASIEIAAVVVEQARQRFEAENERIRDYKVRRGVNLWTPPRGYYGINFGTIIPWSMYSCNEFRCPKPDLDSSSMRAEVQVIREEMKTINGRKLNAIQYWAYDADWGVIADEYMTKQNTPIEKRLDVRSSVYSAVADALGAAFDSKYTHWVQRPSQYDNTIAEVIPAPSHPSYPSGHSTVGRAAAVVLSYHFPENSHVWDGMAEESGMSRIWAGIHYPMDHDSGVELGERVGLEVINAQQ